MRFLRKLLSRMVLVSLGIAIQLAWLFLILFYLSDAYLPIAFFLSLISLLAVIYIIDRPGNPQVKMAWIVPILVFPLFGGIIFFISGGKRPKRKLRRALDESGEMLKPLRGGISLRPLPMPPPLPLTATWRVNATTWTAAASPSTATPPPNTSRIAARAGRD